MPGNITDVDAFTSPVVHPVDGDAVAGAGLQTLAQNLSNRTRFLYNRTAGDRTIVLLPIPASSANDYFAGDIPGSGNSTMVSGGPMIQSGTPGSDPICNCPWYNAPIDGRITEVRANVIGAWSSAVHAGLPSSMPSMQLWKIDPSTGTVTQVGSTATDASGSVGAYEAAHVLTISSLTQLIDGFVFFLLFRGEDDTNALAESFAVMSVEFDVEPV